MPRYKKDFELLPAGLIERLRAALQEGCEVTFRRSGAYTQTEQRLPVELRDEVRQSLPWGERASMQVYVKPGSVEPRNEARDRAAKLLRKGHGIKAVADAAGLDESSVRRVAKREGVRVELGRGAVTVTDDMRILVAGLDAVRDHAGYSYAVLEEATDLDSSVLSRLLNGHRHPDPETVQIVLEAIARKLRCTEHRLRQRAFLAGAAVMDALGEVEVSRVPARSTARRADDDAGPDPDTAVGG
jgi:transcriptional regulator with XRE-family HTH domain